MTIGFADWDTNTEETSPEATLTLSAPGGSPNILIATLLWDGDTAPGNPTAPTGWTLLSTTVPQSGLQGASFWAPSSVSAFTWSFSTSCYAAGQVLGYSGLDDTTPVSASSAVHADSASAVKTTAIDVPTGNWFACAFAPYAVAAETWSTPTGLTKRSSTGPFGWFDSNAAAAGSAVTATSTGTPTSSESVAFGFAINPGTSGSIAVTASLNSSWRILANVAKSISSSWRIHGLVPGAILSSWRILAIVSVQLPSIWRLLGYAKSSTSLSWKIRGLVSHALSAGWRVRNYVLSPEPFRFEIEGPQIVSTAIYGIWHIRGIVASSLTAAWRLAIVEDEEFGTVGSETVVTNTVGSVTVIPTTVGSTHEIAYTVGSETEGI